SSPTSWCGYFDFLSSNAKLFSYDSTKRALLEDNAQVPGGLLFETNRKDDAAALAFTRWMHSVSMAPAMAWPTRIDLSMHRHLLDVAGGSGAHAIGAVTHWPTMRATVFDFPNVCALALEYASAAGLSERIGVHSGDMWNQPFPEADVHLYSQIF